MALCNTMPLQYTLAASGTQDGVYTTSSDLTNNWYTYWGPNAWHFTFGPTGNGTADQSQMTSMHISIPLVGYGGNVSIYFDTNGVLGGNNVARLPSAQQTAATNLLNDNQAVLQAMATEIVTYLVYAPPLRMFPSNERRAS